MIKYKKLDSGISLVSEYEEDNQAASIGIFVGAGSCSESKEIEGISHVIEHMFFKGTKTRTAKDIALEADNLGAQYNAFTGKEATCYHIKALTEVFPKAVDILLDMMLNSLFDPKELKRELGVIREEMHMTQDTPDDYVMDLLTDRVFYGTELQSSIIGTKKTLAGMSHEKIVEYINTYYKADNIVVAVVGKFDEKQLIKQLDDAFSVVGKTASKIERKLPDGKARYASKSKDINQSHIAIGIPSLALDSDDYYAQSIVNDYLGGSMSSLLFQNIREQKGLAYAVYSFPMTYSKTGAFCIYSGLSLGKEKLALDAIAQELESLGKNSISSENIALIKQRLKSSYIFSREKMDSRMFALGKNRLLLGRNYSPEETMAEIDAVTKSQVDAFCKHISDISAYSGAIISKEKLSLKDLI